MNVTVDILNEAPSWYILLLIRIDGRNGWFFALVKQSINYLRS